MIEYVCHLLRDERRLSQAAAPFLRDRDGLLRLLLAIGLLALPLGVADDLLKVARVDRVDHIEDPHSVQLALLLPFVRQVLSKPLVTWQ